MTQGPRVYYFKSLLCQCNWLNRNVTLKEMTLLLTRLILSSVKTKLTLFLNLIMHPQKNSGLLLQFVCLLGV